MVEGFRRASTDECIICPQVVPRTARTQLPNIVRAQIIWDEGKLRETRITIDLQPNRGGSNSTQLENFKGV